MSPQELLNAHRIKLSKYGPGQYYTTCPECSAARSEQHKALKVLGVLIEPGDKITWHCNHCDWSGPPKGSGEGRSKTELPSHIYRDRDGVIRFRKVRNRPGKEPRFWLEQPDGKGGWKKGTKGVDTKLIYRADELKAAMEAGRTIAIVEGEKDADNLWAIGIPATCNAHGASEPGKRPKWDGDHVDQLKDANVVVLMDNDAAGYAHADAVRGSLVTRFYPQRPRWLDLKDHWPEIPKGGDVSDWLAVGGDHTPERLKALIASAPYRACDRLPSDPDYALPERDSAPVNDSAAAADDEPRSETESDAAPLDEDAELERLAKLSLVEFDRARKAAAEKLGVRASILDKLVALKRSELGLDTKEDGKQGRPMRYDESEPWPEPVDGAALLDEIAAALERFMILPEHGATIGALWPVHTHCLDIFTVTPRLQISAPDSECGKTTLLYVLNAFAYRAQNAAAVTPALLFRIMDKFRPTLMLDEADALLPDNEDLRQIIDIGHHRFGEVPRLVGDDHEPRSFRAYGPVAYGMIGELSGKLRTLDSRSIVIRLKRKLATETVEDFDIDRSPAELAPIARRIVRFIKDNMEAIAAAKPNVPHSNRRRDNWVPLFKIAEVAGGEWPQRVLAAATAKEEAARSLLEELLFDIRDSFDSRGRDRISSAELIEGLCEIPARPWGEFGKSGKPLTQNKLARLLKPLAVTPQLIRLPDSDDPVRGYQRSQFEEAFERYLSPKEGVSNRYNVTNAGTTGTSDLFKPLQTDPDVTVPKCEKSNNDGVCNTVTVEKGGGSANGGTGLAVRVIDALGSRYEDDAYRRISGGENEADVRRELDAEVRRRLREYGVLPEFIEVEFKRVIDAAFRPRVH